MPNSANARGEKDKKKKDKKKKTDPPPLHKEDNTSVDSSSLSLSLSPGSKGGTVGPTSAKGKDAFLPLLHLGVGTVKTTASLSSKAEPKSDAAVEWDNCQSLTKAEKATAYKEAKDANPGVVGEDFVVAYLPY
jgi:hypothetical protein